MKLENGNIKNIKHLSRNQLLRWKKGERCNEEGRQKQKYDENAGPGLVE